MTGIKADASEVGRSGTKWSTPPLESFGNVKKLEWCEKELHGDNRKRNWDDDQWHWFEKELHGDHRKRNLDDD